MNIFVYTKIILLKIFKITRSKNLKNKLSILKINFCEFIFLVKIIKWNRISIFKFKIKKQ